MIIEKHREISDKIRKQDNELHSEIIDEIKEVFKDTHKNKIWIGPGVTFMFEDSDTGVLFLEDVSSVILDGNEDIFFITTKRNKRPLKEFCKSGLCKLLDYIAYSPIFYR